MAGTITNSFSAPDIKIILNRQAVGIANEINFTVDYSILPVPQLDSVVMREFVPGSFKASGRVAGFMIRSVSLEQCGIFTAAGANLIQPYINLQILDRRTNQTIFNFPSAIISDLAITTRSSSNLLFDFSFVSFGTITDFSTPLQSVYTVIPPTDA